SVALKTGGGRWITPGILPSALRAAPLARRVQNCSRQFCRTGGAHPPPRNCPATRKTGGGRWIRTTEGVSQQIYSLPPLAAWVSLRNFVSKLLRIRDHRTSRRHKPAEDT